MWLTDIEADRLRNLKAVSLRLPAGLAVLAGANGQGKSSVLEAVYLLATGSSFRTRRRDDMVAWNGGPLRVAGKVESRAGESELKVIMDGERRSLRPWKHSRKWWAQTTSNCIPSTLPATAGTTPYFSKKIGDGFSQGIFSSPSASSISGPTNG